RHVLSVDIASDTELQCGLACPEEVVRYTRPRVEVFPVVHVEASSMQRGIPAACRQILVEHLTLVPVEAEPGVDGGALDRPSILCVETSISLDRFALITTRPEDDV